jgi:hypothetical protein
MTPGRLSAAVIARRLLIALGVLLFALGLAACGDNHPHLAGTSQHIQNVADANNDGAYVDAGPITYQLQISRELNQYSVEDAAYVKGLPSGVSTSVGPTQLWYGVFMWAQNQTNSPQTTSDNFEITDTQGDTYFPVKLDSQLNPFAWTSQTLRPLGTEPGPNTVTSYGPTQGGLLLFKVPTSVYSNRPLTLFILGSDNQKLGSISLNL